MRVAVEDAEDAASEVRGDSTAAAVGTVDELLVTVTAVVDVGAADDEAPEAAILAATSAALTEVGVDELDAGVVEVIATEEVSWAATDVEALIVVETSVGSLEEVLLRPITWTLNAAADAAGVAVTEEMVEAETGTTELEGMLLPEGEAATVGSAFAAETEVAVLVLVTVTVVVIVAVAVAISSALAALGLEGSGTKTRVTF